MYLDGVLVVKPLVCRAPERDSLLCRLNGVATLVNVGSKGVSEVTVLVVLKGMSLLLGGQTPCQGRHNPRKGRFKGPKLPAGTSESL